MGSGYNATDYGGGGGGGWNASLIGQPGGAGYKGIVIIRYTIPYP
jgi:hypothetical protein